jgi:Ser/Thr protein kinase RdoA (MazF antagonist)
VAFRCGGATPNDYDNGMSEFDIQAVLPFYALSPSVVRQIEPLANAGGWSGSRLWRVTEFNGNLLCLRRWPQGHPDPERLRLIHAVLTLVASQLPAFAFPLPTAAGETYVECSGHLWELTAWRPGSADYHAHPSPQRLRAALQTLARFHDLAARYMRCPAVAPTILDRQKRWKSLQENGLHLIERSIATPLGNEIDKRASRLLMLGREALASSRAIQSLASAPELWLQPAIRDIHHDHILFTGDEVTGIVDFGALRIDTPLTDIARLVGSLVGDDQDARQIALGAYSELRPLSESDRRLIGLLDETGLILGALHWLIWLYAERRDMGPAEPIIQRLDEILARLETKWGRHSCLS